MIVYVLEAFTHDIYIGVAREAAVAVVDGVLALQSTKNMPIFQFSPIPLLLTTDHIAWPMGGLHSNQALKNTPNIQGNDHRRYQVRKNRLRECIVEETVCFRKIGGRWKVGITLDTG